MSIAPLTAPGKPNTPMRLRPSKREGLNIMYKIKDSGASSATIARTLNVHPSNISKVTSGQRHSALIESEIARILHKKDWNEVVMEARSETQKKTIEIVLLEMEQKAQTRLENLKKETKNRMREYAVTNSENAVQAIPDIGPKGRKPLNRKAAGL